MTQFELLHDTRYEFWTSRYDHCNLDDRPIEFDYCDLDDRPRTWESYYR